MKRMILTSYIFETKKNLPEEEEKTEREGPFTSYSHLEESKKLSKRETPSLGRKRKYRLTSLLPKSMQIIHEDHKQARREMSEESPKGFESQTNSRSSHSGCEHAATHCDIQCSHDLRSSMRQLE